MFGELRIKPQVLVRHRNIALSKTYSFMPDTKLEHTACLTPMEILALRFDGAEFSNMSDVLAAFRAKESGVSWSRWVYFKLGKHKPQKERHWIDMYHVSGRLR